MQYSLPCGKGRVLLDAPENTKHNIVLLEGSDLPALADPKGALDASLADPTGSEPLARLAGGKKSACIVVSDITRPVPNSKILPPMLAALETAGLSRDSVTILIATGMHRPNLGAELDELLGAEIAANWKVVNHDCRDRANLAEVAKLSGHALEINRHYLDAELKIVTGLIEPHPFAGFSGGAKSILPGVASLETMRFMHSFEMVAHPEVRAANLAGNPFQEYLAIAAREAGLDFMLNVVLNRGREIAGVFAGGFPEAFAAGCGLAAGGIVLREERRFDLVVTCGGGHPLDAILYQASKGLDPAARLAREGGEVLWIADCANGVGGAEFAEMAAMPGGAEAFNAKYGDPANFTVDQWGAQLFFKNKSRLSRLHLYAPCLGADTIRKMGMEPVTDLQGTWQELCGRCNDIAVLPEGPYVSVA